MSSEPKSPKPVPSPAEINAYLEKSAARTRLRLPLAKGNAVPVAGPDPAAGAPGAASPAPGAQGKPLPVQPKALPVQPKAPPVDAAGDGGWRPFNDDEGGA